MGQDSFKSAESALPTFARLDKTEPNLTGAGSTDPFGAYRSIAFGAEGGRADRALPPNEPVHNGVMHFPPMDHTAHAKKPDKVADQIPSESGPGHNPNPGQTQADRTKPGPKNPNPPEQNQPTAPSDGNPGKLPVDKTPKAHPKQL